MQRDENRRMYEAAAGAVSNNGGLVQRGAKAIANS